MATLTAAQRSKLEALRRRYLAAVPDRIATLRRALSEAEEHGYERQSLLALFDVVHRFAGSSAVYGLALVSGAARRLEERICEQLQGGNASACEAFAPLLAEVERCWSRIGGSSRSIAPGACSGPSRRRPRPPSA